MTKKIPPDLKLILDKVLCDLRRQQFSQPWQVRKLPVDNQYFFPFQGLENEWCLWLSSAAIRQHLLSKGFPWRRNPLLISNKTLSIELNMAGLIASQAKRMRAGVQLEYRIGISLYALQWRGFNVDGLSYEK